MRTFIWKDIRRVTTRHHNGGGVLVVAVDLEQARHFLNVGKRPNDNWYEGADEDEPKDFPLVPDDCEAYTLEPSITLDAGNEPSGLVLMFPNHGCC